MPQGVGTNQNLNFNPASFTVVVGTNNTITFSDQDSTAPHNVYFTSMPSGANPNANAPAEMVKGNSFTVTLTVPGTYDYECQFHSTWMMGVITVTG